MKKDHSRNYESEIEVAFRCFDRHGNGFISRQELGHIFQVSEERKFLPCSFYILYVIKSWIKRVRLSLRVCFYGEEPLIYEYSVDVVMNAKLFAFFPLFYTYALQL